MDVYVNFECNQNFILTGDKRRFCQDNGRWNIPDYGYTECLRNQEYSSRTLGATWGIISAVMLPIVVVLICIGWRILKRRKEEERDESDFIPIKTRPIDPEESMKMTSDDDSIPYKKDTTEDIPESNDNVKVVDVANDNNSYPYQYQDNEPLAQYPQQEQQYPQPQQIQQPQPSRQWAGETEIN